MGGGFSHVGLLDVQSISPAQLFSSLREPADAKGGKRGLVVVVLQAKNNEAGSFLDFSQLI